VSRRYVVEESPRRSRRLVEAVTPLETALTEIEKRAEEACRTERYGYDVVRADVPRLVKALRVLLQAYDDADENAGCKDAVEANVAAILRGDAP
jgi:hypothetical protein